MRVLWIAAIVLLTAAFSDGLICYTCQFAGGQDSSCLTDPTSSQFTDCTTARYCRTQLMEYTDGGGIASFARLCSPSSGAVPEYLNATVKDAHHITHFTACNWDKCNTGDGEWKGSSGNHPSLGVPGKGYNGVSALAPLAWMTALLIAVAMTAGRLG